MNTLDRFFKYIAVDTTSDENSKQSPSNNQQKILAEILQEELKELGIKEVYYDQEHCYLYAAIKGNVDTTKIGFVAHLDTSAGAVGSNIKPQIIKDYNGQEVKLSNEVIMKPGVYPDLANHKGKTLITTNGTTLLGADDKAGIAEIMGMLEYFSTSNEDHGDIYVCFTPDEEIGKGIKYFDFSKFKADVAYTVDGSTLGEISYENFNAATAKIKIMGTPTHCGRAKDRMVNSLLIANTINSLLPEEIPANTEGYEGFYHLGKITGNVSYTEMSYLIRDFDQQGFENRKRILSTIVEQLNEKYQHCIQLEIKDSYYNMSNIINQNLEVVDLAKQAIKNCNINPIVMPIRGGTDGAILTYQNLPCPNLGTGGHNFHSVYEYITLEDMEKTTQVLIEIAKQYAYKSESVKTKIKKEG